VSPDDQQSVPGQVDEALPVGLVLALAAVVEILLQSLRAFFPLGYHLVGSLGFVLTPLVLVTVFLSPLLVIALARLVGQGSLVVVLGAAAVVSRLLLQVDPTLAIAAGAVVVSLLAVTALLPTASGHRFGSDVLAAGLLVGLGLDVALRAWRATDDVVWSQGWHAWLDPSLLVPVALVVAGLPTLGRASWVERTAPSWTWFVLLMPAMLLWTSPAFVGSGGGAPLSAVTVVLLGSVAAAMALLAWPPARGPWPVPVGLVGASALAMPWLAGWPVLTAAVLATVATPLLLREAAARSVTRPWSVVRHAATATAGAVTMFILLLLYPLHYEIPLPLSNRWLPALAVLLSLVPLLRRPQAAVAREFATPSGLHTPALLLVSSGSLVLGLMVHVGMVGGSPLPGPDESLASGEPSSGGLAAATYNVGQGQDATSGRLAFRTVAETIAGLDADVVAVQEVARGWPLTAMSDLDAWLRANTDWTVHYVPAADHQLGNALLSRVALSDVTAIDLGQGGGAQRRSAIRADLPDGTRVYGMHLQARNTVAAQRTRLEQMQMIVEDWGGRPGTVLAGDLNPRNEYVDEAETPPKVITNLEVFTDAGLVTSQPTQSCTTPTSNDNCSDYVFISPDMVLGQPIEVVDVDVSDHRPVRARVDTPGRR